MENPIQFTMVSDVPLDSSGAFWATKVENRGESAITTSPQKNKKPINAGTELINRNNGERQQHKQERNKAPVATCLTPNPCERYPPNTQANPPEAIITKDTKGKLTQRK